MNRGSRDLRVDLLRGLAMVAVVVNHIRVPSLFQYVSEEPFMLVTGGEVFVTLSGFTLGMVYARRLAAGGWTPAAVKIADRALRLYRVFVFVAISTYVLRFVPWFSSTEIATIAHTPGGEPAGFRRTIAEILLLRAGPNIFNIIGLYVVLSALTAPALWLLMKGRYRLLLGASWILYLIGVGIPGSTTGMQFEHAFRLLSWQLIFFHALAAGYHRDWLTAYFRGRRALALIGAAGLAVACFWLFSMNSPEVAWRVRHWPVIPSGAWRATYAALFRRYDMGLGRVAYMTALLILLYAILTRFWATIHRTVGWLLLPLGEASLTVFIVHVYVVGLIAHFFVPRTPGHGLMLNTLVQAAAVAVLWFVARHPKWFGWIPR